MNRFRCRRLGRKARSLATLLSCCTRGALLGDQEPATTPQTCRGSCPGTRELEMAPVPPGLSPSLSVADSLTTVSSLSQWDIDDLSLTSDFILSEIEVEEDVTAAICSDVKDAELDTHTDPSLDKKTTGLLSDLPTSEVVEVTQFECEETLLPESQVAEIVTIDTDGNDNRKSASDVQKENDCSILRSILDDGNYEISEDDRAALETVVSSLSTLPPYTMTHDTTESVESSTLSTINDDDDVIVNEVNAFVSDLIEDVLSVFEDTHSIRADESRDSDILQSILDDGHYDISTEDATALRAVIASMRASSEQSKENEMESLLDNVHSADSQGERDSETLQSIDILDDGHYDISSEDASALQGLITSMRTSCEQKEMESVLDNTFSNARDVAPDQDERGILQSILDDGHYDTSSEDTSAVIWSMTNSSKQKRMYAKEEKKMECFSTTATTSLLSSHERFLLSSTLSDGQHEGHVATQNRIDSVVSVVDSVAVSGGRNTTSL